MSFFFCVGKPFKKKAGSCGIPRLYKALGKGEILRISKWSRWPLAMRLWGELLSTFCSVFVVLRDDPYLQGKNLARSWFSLSSIPSSIRLKALTHRPGRIVKAAAAAEGGWGPLGWEVGEDPVRPLPMGSPLLFQVTLWFSVSIFSHVLGHLTFTSECSEPSPLPDILRSPIDMLPPGSQQL